jgi:NADH:ubiquinone oxidoreductase subunit 6 (subunit J)
MMFSMMLPVLSAICVAIYAGGLGIIFMIIFGEVVPHSEEHVEEAAPFITAGEINVVLLGLIITIGVPIVAWLLQKKFDS